jgi:NDP-sugar pyrophosphorylase family protein
LRGWQNVKTRETRWCGEQHDLSGMVTQPFAFSGIQALQPAIFEWMPADETFPIMDVYLRAAAASSVKGYLHDEDFWLDVGKPEAIVKAIQWFGK